MIIIGPSGSGKKQLFLNLIIRWLRWSKLYLIAPSVDDQHCYEVVKDFNEKAKSVNKDGDDIIVFITDIDINLYFFVPHILHLPVNARRLFFVVIVVNPVVGVDDIHRKQYRLMLLIIWIQ